MFSSILKLFGVMSVGGLFSLIAKLSANRFAPAIMGTFGIGRDQAQLISTGYFASQTAGMLLSAWLIKAFGERQAQRLLAQRAEVVESQSVVLVRPRPDLSYQPEG